MKMLLIVNEYAGKGKTKKCWPKLQRCLQNYGLSYEVHFTSKPKEAVEIARHAAEQYSHVVAVGGDGTANEVVNGIAGRNTIFGVLPTGTGNDLARMLEIPQQLDLAVKKLGSRMEKPMDLMELNGMFIAGAVGIGFDGAIAEDINRTSWKKRAGTLGYVLSMLKLLFTFQPFALHLEIDGRTADYRNCWLVAIGNSKFYGGGMKICPDALHDDGWLDVCIVQNMSRMELLKLFPSVFSGKHVLHRNVLCMRGKNVQVLTDPAVPMHGDGEMIGQTPGVIRIHPGALNVMYGSSGRKE